MSRAFSTSGLAGHLPYPVAGRAAVDYLRGRLRFGAGEDSAPFPSALAIWGASPEAVAALDAALPEAWRAGDPRGEKPG